METLTHGSGAAAGGAIRSPTVTGARPTGVVILPQHYRPRPLNVAFGVATRVSINGGKLTK